MLHIACLGQAGCWLVNDYGRGAGRHIELLLLTRFTATRLVGLA